MKSSRTDDHAPTSDRPRPWTAAALRDWIVAHLATALQRDPAEVPLHEPFTRFGLDSLGATRMIAALSRATGRRLSPTLVWEHPTIASLVAHLTQDPRRPAAAPGSAGAGAPFEPIAVIGMSCRFPGAADVPAFWRLLFEGRDAIVEIPDDRWDVDAYHAADPRAPGTMISRRAAMLEHVDLFDPMFFGISPREAKEMDPQQRLALELSWEALEDAGVVASKLSGTPTGVFLGAIWHDYGDLALHDLATMSSHRATGQSLNMIANRVSYSLGLQGPSVVVDSACSSALVAVSMACQSLHCGDATMALVGGINLILAPSTMVALTKFGGLSPSGCSRAFDAGADGFGRGEGGGIVVLKPYRRALQDGDTVRCVIRSCAVNNDGASNGLTAPNPVAQHAVLRRAYQRAGVAPARVHYVEAHGTGTPLGDPIEARALGAIMGDGRAPDHPLRIGSVKSNIGHLEGAAGIAGLIKTALSIEHRTLPASLHFERPNPHIDFEHLGVKVVAEREPWPTGADRPAWAGVSSFGWGGTNAHVVLEGAPLPVRWLALAAASRAELLQSVDALRRALGTRPLEDLFAEAAPTSGPHQLVCLARDDAQVSEQLASFLEGRDAPDLFEVSDADRPRPRLVFVCSPQGSQWAGMARQLMEREPVFRAVLSDCDAHFVRLGGRSLLPHLLCDAPGSLPDDVDVVQPSIVAIQIALAAQLDDWGIAPDAVVGHSMGEISAACIAGILEPSAAMHAIFHYSRLQKTTAGRGGMALVDLPPSELEPLLAAHGGALCVAANNGPRSTVISGEVGALEAVLAQLRARDVPCAAVNVNVAAHSSQMDVFLDELRASLATLRPRPARTPMISTCTEALVEGPELGADYLADNLRHRVRFAQVCRQLMQDGPVVFLELSPHPVLGYAMEQLVESSGLHAHVLPTLLRGEDEQLALLRARARLVALGTGPACAPARGELDVFPLSARSHAALVELAKSTAAWIREHSGASLRALCHSARLHRSHHAHRLAALVNSRDELVDELTGFAQDEPAEGLLVTRSTAVRNDDLQHIAGLDHPLLKTHVEQVGALTSAGVTLLANLYVRGHDVEWNSFGLPVARRVSLPLYPWQRRRCWRDRLTPPATPTTSATTPEQ
ncbi:MAG: acyltransferase domain-containing protein [Myxococcales bacterium]|nr:acyltransferase domain-containing protein [Myxococcales bacterium]